MPAFIEIIMKLVILEVSTIF